MPKLFLDIETLPLPHAVAQLPDPAAPANYKDAEKIAAWVASKRAEQLREAALDPDTGRCAMIAFADGAQGMITLAAMLPYSQIADWNATHEVLKDDDRDFTCDDWHIARFDLETLQYGALTFDPIVFAYNAESDAIYAERNLLDFFWLQWAEHDGEVCGYNVVSFDLNFIMRRTLYTSATPQLPMPSLRYNNSLSDLYTLLYGYKPGGKGLKTVTKLLGIPNPFTDAYGKDVDGEASLTLPPFERMAYCASDVWLTQQLAQKMNGLYTRFEELAQTDEVEFPF